MDTVKCRSQCVYRIPGEGEEEGEEKRWRKGRRDGGGRRMVEKRRMRMLSEECAKYTWLTV